MTTKIAIGETVKPTLIQRIEEKYKKNGVVEMRNPARLPQSNEVFHYLEKAIGWGEFNAIVESPAVYDCERGQAQYYLAKI